MMKTSLFFITTFLCSVFAFPSKLPSGIVAEDIANGLGIVTDFAFLDANRTIVANKAGRVLLIKNGQIQWDKPFADFSGLVGAAAGDRGLTSLEPHPRFPEVPFLYVSYQLDLTPKVNPGGPRQNIVSRFTVRGDALDMSSEKILIGQCKLNTTSWHGGDCAPCLGNTHGANQVFFGPDEQLYVAVGDGEIQEGYFWWGRGMFDVPTSWLAAMDPNFLGGKILRLHPDNGLGLPDNPFFNGDPASAASKVWSVGLRNPWRSTFVPGDRSTILVGQVGWASFEAITVAHRGNNGGWPCYEGVVPTPPQLLKTGGKIPPTNSTDNARTPGCMNFYAGKYPGVPPFYPSTNALTMDHSGKSAAIIGGVFPGDKYPAPLNKAYMFADFVTGRIFGLPWDSANQKPGSGGTPFLFAENSDDPVSFKVNKFDGLVYYIGECNRCSKMGVLRRFVPGKTDKNSAPPSLVMDENLVSHGDAPPVYNPNLDRPIPKTPATCDVKSIGPNLPPLPSGWDTVMLAGQFPNMQTKQPNGGPVEVDSSVGGPNIGDGNQITIGKVRYQRGLGMRSQGLAGFPLAGNCYRFMANVGVDDETNGKGYGEFIVQHSGKVVYNSTSDLGKPIHAGDVPRKVDLRNLQSVQTFYLNALKPYGNTFNVEADGDHLDWGDAKFLCGPDAPFLPEVQIVTPLANAGPQNIGTVITFSGLAYDYSGYPLDFGKFVWNINLIHCQGPLCHTHYLFTMPGLERGRFIIEDHELTAGGQYYYYEIQLTVKDQCGRSMSASRNVLVNLVKTAGDGNSTDSSDSTIPWADDTSAPEASATAPAPTATIVETVPSETPITGSDAGAASIASVGSNGSKLPDFDPEFETGDILEDEGVVEIPEDTGYGAESDHNHKRSVRPQHRPMMRACHHSH